jgi:hypothetical protein
MYASRPKWWMLYATVPLMLIALLAVSQTHWLNWVKTTAAIIVVVGAFGGMTLWMKANAGTILRAEYADEKRLRAKLYRRIRAPRSHAIPSAAPSPIPRSGFGSARFRPTHIYMREQIAAQVVRISRVITSQGKSY